MPILKPKCSACETDMVLKEKDGSKFWGCPNWQRCKGKTQRYEGVDKPQTQNFVITEEMWGRMELKLDWIIDNLQNKPMIQSLGMQPATESDDMESIKEILNENQNMPF